MEELNIITKRLGALEKKASKKSKQKKYDFFKENVLEMIKVEEFLEKPQIVDIHTPIDKVMKTMSENNVVEVLVSMNGEIVGMITISNLLESLRERKHLPKLEARAIMKKVIKINKKDNLSKAILIMSIHKVPCLAVFDKNNLVGVISKTGILKKLSKIIFTSEYRVEEADVIETKVDQLIDLLEKGEVEIEDIKKKLNINDEQLDEWLKILEKQGIIKIEKSLFGKLKVKVKHAR